MPTEKALNASNVPQTGLAPTWLYYGSVGGTAYGAERRPLWRELVDGSYVFAPWSTDKQIGAVWVADFGATVARRYRCGVIGSGYKAFLRVASGVPAGTTTPSIYTYFQDTVIASPAIGAGNLSAALAGLFVQPEPVLSGRRPWSDKGAVSLVDFGAGCDAEYRYQAQHWGDGALAALDLSQFNVLSVWPSTLPQEPFGEGQAKYTPMDNTIRTENETGPAQVRRRSTTNNDLFEFTITLDPDQMADLETFYRTTLAEVRKFTWVDFRTRLPCNYRFLAPPDATYWASEQADNSRPAPRHWWTVSCRLELVR